MTAEKRGHGAEGARCAQGGSDVREQLLPLLQAAQREDGYVSEQRIRTIARICSMSVAEVYGVATFFNQFKFNKPGRHEVKVCTGTACHVRGAGLVANEFERELGICAGQTTEDGMFSLDHVACVGCCTLAPVVVVDGQVEGVMNSAKVKGLVQQARRAEEGAGPS